MRVFGVLNVTPDSFSDGNQFTSVGEAVEHAHHLIRTGAHIIDVGGESTRPGATQVGVAEEQRRVMPVIDELAREDVPVSIDTIRAATAECAVLAGARYINDVSGGLFDPDMYATVARLSANIEDVYYIIGHWRGFPDPRHSRSVYTDVVEEVRADLADRCSQALDAGVPAERIIIDPGLGFDKTATQCWEILRRLERLQQLGYPVLVGASRKRMLADIAGAGSPVQDRDLATSIVSVLAAQSGVWGVRVHDAEGTRQGLNLLRAWQGTPHQNAAENHSTPISPQPRNSSSHPTPTTDRVTLTGLRCYAHHGVFEFEREAGQPFIIDVDCRVNVAGAHDALANTVHYGELAEAVVRNVESEPVDLIETVAERAAAVALTFPAVQEVTVTVHKPEAPIEVPFADVSVTVTRGRAS